jgi:hypothetical protein
MLRSPIIRVIFGVILAVIVLAVFRYKPWQRAGEQISGGANQPREQLNVGFLPVT